MFSFRYSVLLLFLTTLSCQESINVRDNYNAGSTNSTSASDFLNTDGIPTKAKSLDDFTGNGRRLVKKQVGDLNSDTKEDAVLVVLQPVGVSNQSNTEAELLFLIILQTTDGEFQLDAVSKKLLFHYSDISHASTIGIAIKDGEISVEQIAVAQATLTYHQNALKKTSQGWSVVSGKILLETPTKPNKQGFIKIEVFEQIQRKPKLLKDFDIENFDLTAPKLVRTY